MIYKIVRIKVMFYEFNKLNYYLNNYLFYLTYLTKNTKQDIRAMESENFIEQNSIISVSTKDSYGVEENKEIKKILEINIKIPLEILYEKDFFLDKVVKFFEKIIKENEKLNDLNIEDNKLFSVTELPNINIKDYILRINKFLDPEYSTFIITLIYIYRISLEGILLNIYNIYKLLIVALNLAIKFNEDDYSDNKYTAKVGGIKLKEMNKLEEIFLLRVNFNLWVNEEEFESYCSDFFS